MKLTEKQKIFCDEYIISLNATQAAIKAGYAEKTAYAIGAENLKKPKIQSYISERMEQKESFYIKLYFCIDRKPALRTRI